MNPLYEIENHFPDFRKDLADKVPEHLREGLARYVIHGIIPGSFLQAVISNDLHGAIHLGDDDSLAGIKSILSFLWNSTPSQCFGDRVRLMQWHGLARESA